MPNWWKPHNVNENDLKKNIYYFLFNIRYFAEYYVRLSFCPREYLYEVGRACASRFSVHPCYAPMHVEFSIICLYLKLSSNLLCCGPLIIDRLYPSLNFFSSGGLKQKIFTYWTTILIKYLFKITEFLKIQKATLQDLLYLHWP